MEATGSGTRNSSAYSSKDRLPGTQNLNTSNSQRIRSVGHQSSINMSSKDESSVGDPDSYREEVKGAHRPSYYDQELAAK